MPRLFDIVIQSPKTQVCSVTGPKGKTRVMSAAGSLASAISSCSLRYVLDRPASAQVSALMFTPGGVLEHPDELTRLPARPFWLECFPDEDAEGQTGRGVPGRLGFYVVPTAEGKHGTIECVRETIDGGAGILAGHVEFDLSEGPPPISGQLRHRMRHAESKEINHVLERARLVIGRDWHELARTVPDRYTEFVTWQAERAWYALPVLLCFAALLNARTALVQRPSSLHRLNLARRRMGRPALVEHIEVGLNLTPSEPNGQSRQGVSGGRHPPHFHFVRGHSVTRAGQTFWRTSHFRGVGAEPVKTVRVTSGRSTLRHV